MESNAIQSEKSFECGKIDDLIKYLQTKLDEHNGGRHEIVRAQKTSAPKAAEAAPALTILGAIAYTSTMTVMMETVHQGKRKAPVSKEYKTGEKD